jgi:protein-tyrosine phosphatase
MKYGILFSIVAALLVTTAVIHRGWHLLSLWPALSFAVVAIGYFRTGPSVFGKSPNGKLSFANQAILLPYLLYLWSVWRCIRIVKRASAFDCLTEDIVIGRRLLSHEFPKNIDHVIDLTCEFTEPEVLRSHSYWSFQISDASVPSPEEFQTWVRQSAELTGNLYIHCAEGHGRTGLFAAALLLHRGHCSSPDDAIRFIQSKRPLVRLGKRQLAALAEFHEASNPSRL